MRKMILLALVMSIVLIKPVGLDPNNDGLWDSADCSYINRYIWGIYDHAYPNYDVNRDGSIDKADIEKMIDIIIKR